MPTFIDRRKFLQCLGGTLLALPTLEACRSAGDRGEVGPIARGESALVTNPAKRLVVFGVWNGIRTGSWYPTGTESAFTLKSTMAPLAKHQSNLIVTKGIDNAIAAANHGPDEHFAGARSVLSGGAPIYAKNYDYGSTSSGISVDQQIAKIIEASGVLTATGSVQLAAGGNSLGVLSFAGPKQPLSAEADPKNAFANLFANASKTKDELAKAAALQKSLLDGSKSDYTKLSAQVSGEDRRRIDAHLQAIRDIEKRLATTVQCNPDPSIVKNTDLGVVWSSMMDITVQALACDVTRVVTLSYDHPGGGGPQFPWLGVTDDIHEVSHALDPSASASDVASTKYDKVMTWFSQGLATFVDKLKAIDMPGGVSLFDETVVLRVSETGCQHSYTDIPFLLLAGQKTPFKTGRYVQLKNAKHNDFLVTLLHAFGGNQTQFGDPAYSTGNLDAQLLST
jgi:hypothetical protein